MQTMMNKELRSLDFWMKKNKLKVNCSKTVSMLLGTKYMLVKNNTLDLNLGGVRLTQVESYKYLGVHVDAELKWDLHIDHLCKKVGKMVNYLCRLKQFISASNLKSIYNSGFFYLTLIMLT